MVILQCIGEYVAGRYSIVKIGIFIDHVRFQALLISISEAFPIQVVTLAEDSTQIPSQKPHVDSARTVRD